jgi:UDP-2,3-diacylglucosamine pyrophosphatase LpxH
MIESNPNVAAMIATPEDAAAEVIEAVLAGEPYVITHGDLTRPVSDRFEKLRRAAAR